jgi:hypothetical protein
MRPEPQMDAPRKVFKVSEWKWGVDAGSPWWRRAFFKYAFLPFINFSFGVVGIPTPKECEVTSDENGRVTKKYSWFEDVAILPDEDMADNACLNEHTGYKPMFYGKVAPHESGQSSGTIFPRKKKGSRKWANPALSLVIKDRKEDERERETLAECLKQINQVLDQ